MIKLERTETYGWEAAVRGMRNPLNSWEKSDSHYCWDLTPNTCNLESDNVYHTEKFFIGGNDLTLMQKLATSGNDHGKFLRMITVTVDVTAPLYWWKEFDTYKIGTVANSCSTMHKIQDKEFTMADFSMEYIGIVPNSDPVYYNTLETVIYALNEARRCYLDTKDKAYWWQMIQLLPSSYNQKRTVQLNYAVLRNIYHSRKNHKLDEWQEFCQWIERLRYSTLITM